MGESYFLLVKKLFKGSSLPAADERTGAGRNISPASVPVLYFAHTWRVLEYKRNHLYIFGYQKSSQSESGTLQKLAFDQEVTDSRNKILSPLPSSNWKETLQLHLVCVCRGAQWREQGLKRRLIPALFSFLSLSNNDNF